MVNLGSDLWFIQVSGYARDRVCVLVRVSFTIGRI